MIHVNNKNTHTWLISYCKYCKDTSFGEIVDDVVTNKCYRCKREYKKK